MGLPYGENFVILTSTETTEENDLGIYLTEDLKAAQQCTKAASKATSVLRMIRRNFHRTDVEDSRIRMLDLIWNMPFKHGRLTW